VVIPFWIALWSFALFLEGDNVDEVAVSRRSYRPVAFSHVPPPGAQDEVRHVWRVRSLEYLSETPNLFRPREEAQPTHAFAARIVNEELLPTAEGISPSLSRAMNLVTERSDGLQLRKVLLRKLPASSAEGAQTPSRVPRANRAGRASR